MIKKNDLLGLMAEGLYKIQELTLAEQLFLEGDRIIPMLLKLSFHDHYRIAFRSARMLELLMQTHPELFLQHLPEFFTCYPKQKNVSAQRHYTKLMMHLICFQGGQANLG